MPQQTGHETILLVEDDEAVRALALRVLQDQGYCVLDASNGEHALAEVSDNHVQVALLVTDIVMPGMGGGALAERLASLQPGLKVLFMSGYTEDAILRHGVEAEQVHFLPKPYTPTDLAAKVRQVLDAVETRT